VVELGADPEPEELCAALQRALGDPSLQLAYWIPDSKTWIDIGGNPLDLTEESEDRATTLVEHQGKLVAALVHDATLAKERDRVEGVAAAASLALARERSIQALRQSERRYRALLNAIPDLMFRISRDGTYLAYKGDRRDLAAPPTRLLGSSVHDLLPPDVADRLMEGVQRALASGEIETIEYELALDGVPRDFEARIVSNGDEAVLIVRDFTERKRAEEELRRLQDELRHRLDELRASRARIVEAGDAERRRLERNLHDGAQQRLVSLSLMLRLAQGKVASDPAGADDLLGRAVDEMSLALEELRELARGIHPAVLSDRGLAAALEALAARAPFPVEVETPPERLPPPVEAAAYYVVSESLANAAKYARASLVDVRIRRADGRAVVEIADDGVGGADPGRGSGLRGLADRVEALDGELSVESESGRGTRVRAEIPFG
jgi:PAS domain S-box-containing protein